ncbi:DUF397 domain-containing protein [Streptomyces sp. 2224.1]|uniref:DUF397 domain-containing protein n=1 Tax=Streptomyces sp. 2224.1 TaxID=1881020 RepID=UPI00352654CD
MSTTPNSHPEPVWRKSSYSSGGGNCVEVAALNPGTVAVRDSKNPAPVVHFSRETFALFLGGLRSTPPRGPERALPGTSTTGAWTSRAGGPPPGAPGPPAAHMAQRHLVQPGRPAAGRVGREARPGPRAHRRRGHLRRAHGHPTWSSGGSQS